MAPSNPSLLVFTSFCDHIPFPWMWNTPPAFLPMIVMANEMRKKITKMKQKKKSKIKKKLIWHEKKKKNTAKVTGYHSEDEVTKLWFPSCWRSLTLAHFVEISCHVWATLLGGPRGQEDRLWATASKKRRPLVQSPVQNWSCLTWTLRWVWLLAPHLDVVLRETLSHRTPKLCLNSWPTVTVRW